MNPRILVHSGFIVHLIYHGPDHPKGTHPKSVDLDCLKQDIAKSDLCLQGCVGCPSSWEDFDKFVQSYNSTLSSILDRHAPLKSKVVGSRPQVPCYNQEIAEAKKKRRKAERTLRKTKSAEDLLVFKSLRNHVTYLCNQARRKFYVGFVKELGGDQRKLFRVTKALLMPNDEICFPNCHDKVALENDIARYFHRKILNIRNELHGIDVTQKIWNSLPQSLQSQQNFNAFKSLLKTHYFREAFNFFLVFHIVYIFAFYCKFKIVSRSHSNFGFHFNM